MSGEVAPRFGGRLALVTGASRGIGSAAARALAAEGAHVILVARTLGALEDVDDEIRNAGGAATLAPLDVRDFPALDRLGATIYERWGRLDAFLGNAGVLGTLTPLAQLDPKTFAECLDVNVTANWRLIRSLDPLLRRSDAGRALFVTSGAAHRHRAYWGGYAISKAALEAMVRTYAAECAGSSVAANLLDPGPLRTRMRQKAMPGEDPETLDPPEAVSPLILDLLAPNCTRNGEVVSFRQTTRPETTLGDG